MAENTSADDMNDEREIIELGNNLLDACRYGHVEIVKKLMQHSKVQMLLNQSGGEMKMPPLGYATRFEHYDTIIPILLQHGANPNAISEQADPRTPFMTATSIGHGPTIERMLQFGGDFHFTTNFGISALYIAAENNKEHILEIFRKHGADPKTIQQMQTQLVTRIAGYPYDAKHIPSTKRFLFNYFATVGAPNMLTTSGVLYYEIEVIIQRGYSFLSLGFANKDGIRPSDQKCPKTSVGCNSESWGLLGLQHERGANGKSTGWLGGSWTAGNIIGLAANIDKGMIAVSINGKWDRCSTEYNDDDKLFKNLAFFDSGIQKGVYPCFTGKDVEVCYRLDRSDWDYGPPSEAIWSISRNDFEIASDCMTTFSNILKHCDRRPRKAVKDFEALLEHPLLHTFINEKGRSGLTPLNMATFRGRWDLVPRLVKAGANPDIADHRGWTPFRRAVKKRKVKMIQLFLNAGADPLRCLFEVAEQEEVENIRTLLPFLLFRH